MEREVAFAVIGKYVVLFPFFESAGMEFIQELSLRCQERVIMHQDVENNYNFKLIYLKFSLILKLNRNNNFVDFVKIF